MEKDQKEVYVGRRDFIKTTTLVSIAATFPGANLLGQEAKSAYKASPKERKRNLLLWCDSPETYEKTYEKLIKSIKSIKEFDFSVFPIKADYQKPLEITKSIQEKDADIILMCLPRTIINAGTIPAMMGDINIPVILLPSNFDLIMLEADVVAAFRLKGVNAMLANSESHAIEIIKTAATPRILEGKKIVIFGRPFDSSSIPARNLSEDYVYRHTGVRLQYRPMEELKPLLATVDEAAARKEMERWKREAVKVVEASDQAILDTSRLYVLLRSIVDKEGLSGISIDCLGFSFSANPILPYPCLAFTRLRDEQIAAPCEADVVASLSSMLLQEISRKPSYFCNVSGVNTAKSTTVLRHCVAPTKLMGAGAPPLPYNIRDYHGMGRGATPEVEFPVGMEVSMGGFSKDLKSFVLWPGRTISRVKDTDRHSFDNPSIKMRMYCSNHVEVKIKDVDRFIQNISNCHYVMVAGSYTNLIRDEMLRMNVNVIEPSDSAAPQA
jgi:hypothetical protein